MCDTIDIRTNDDIKIAVSRDVVKMWNTISNMLESYIPGNEDSGGAGFDEIPITEVDNPTLLRVIDYCEQSLNYPEDEEWKKEFFHNTHGTEDLEAIKQHHTELSNLAKAADYLEITALLEDTAQTIANIFQGKSPEKIREEWDFPDDLTEEEKENIIRQNLWAFDL